MRKGICIGLWRTDVKINKACKLTMHKKNMFAAIPLNRIKLVLDKITPDMGKNENWEDWLFNSGARRAIQKIRSELGVDK